MGVNTLDGGSGNDVLDGGAGADIMKGGFGDDGFYVDNAGDQVIEASGQGNDTIYASVSFSLAGTYVESLRLQGSANINATGNSQANSLYGNDGDNVLNGGVGADTMAGGLGNDTYVVDNAGDTVSENAGQGSDLVRSSLTFTLGDFVENLVLTGSTAVNATGNSLNNVITGNNAANIIDAGAGADAMSGLGGNDTYYVDDTGDTVIEAGGGGTDTVFSSVSFTLVGQQIENLTLTGVGNINAAGNSLANALMGNDGDNVINGGFGADSLTGFAGADIFLFGTSSGADTVTDFSAAQNDMININAYTHGTVQAAYIVQVGGDVHINLGGSNVITVAAANIADVSTHMVW